jgi:acetaldehyde dehydrogenase (acetylating)
VARVLVTPQRLPNPALVGKSAAFIAEKCGLSAPTGTRVLIAPLEGVGRDYPLSIEKLCPVLSFYVVRDWREGCERCKQILRYGGMGHTMSIHSQNEQVILEFGLKKPAFRIVVNTPTTHGSIGLTTGLDPAMTLGCGGYGGNITSDNISPRHLLNIKRLAYEVTPAVSRSERGSKASAAQKPPVAVEPAGISAEALTARIDEFLGSRGFLRGDAVPGPKPADTAPEPAPPAPPPVASPPATPLPVEKPLDFVCEEDVRLAIQAGRTLVLSEKAIVTPAARDLGEQHRVFSLAPWRP